MSAVSREQIAQSYDLLIQGDVNEIHKHIQEKKVTMDHLKLMKKLANGTTKDQFIDLVQKGDVPPVKLTNREMEQVKGGALIVLVVGALFLYAAYKGHNVVGFGTVDR